MFAMLVAYLIINAGGLCFCLDIMGAFLVALVLYLMLVVHGGD